MVFKKTKINLAREGGLEQNLNVNIAYTSAIFFNVLCLDNKH